MNKILIFILAATLHAGSLMDHANMLTDVGRVAVQVSDAEIYVETNRGLPAGGLVNYANERVSGLTTNGFLLAVAISPNQYCISACGPYTDSMTQPIGEEMARHFALGDMQGGIEGAVASLRVLLHKKPARLAIVPQDPVPRPDWAVEAEAQCYALGPYLFGLLAIPVVLWAHRRIHGTPVAVSAPNFTPQNYKSVHEGDADNSARFTTDWKPVIGHFPFSGDEK